MAEEKTPQETTVQEPHHTQGRDQEVEQLKELLTRYGTPILAGAVIVALFIIGFGTYRSSHNKRSDQASLALANAESLEDYQQILANYAKTPSAPIARLGLAAEHFNAGDYEAASQAYAAFVADQPGHVMAAGATLAQVQCVEAQGKMEEALKAYTGFIASHPDSYLASYAALGKARCLTELARLDDARSAYEDVIANYPDTIWASRAETDLKQVERLSRASTGK